VNEKNNNMETDLQVVNIMDSVFVCESIRVKESLK